MRAEGARIFFSFNFRIQGISSLIPASKFIMIFPTYLPTRTERSHPFRYSIPICVKYFCAPTAREKFCLFTFERLVFTSAVLIEIALQMF